MESAQGWNHEGPVVGGTTKSGVLKSTLTLELAAPTPAQATAGSGSRCAGCSQGRVGMGAGASPHPALRATFPLRAFQGGYFHRIPRRSSLRLVPHSAKDPQVKAAWSAPGLSPPCFWRLRASSKRCLLLPPGPIPGSEPQHLPLHPLSHTHTITFTNPGSCLQLLHGTWPFLSGFVSPLSSSKLLADPSRTPLGIPALRGGPLGLNGDYMRNSQ